MNAVSGRASAAPILAADACEEDRIEPHVRIGRQTCLGIVCRVKRQPGEDVHSLAACLLDRLAHRRLEAMAEVEDDARVLDLCNLLRCQLQVVRLGSRRREVLDVEASALRSARPRRQGDRRRQRPSSAHRSRRPQPARTGQDKNENDSQNHGQDDTLRPWPAAVRLDQSRARNARRRGLPQRRRPAGGGGAPRPPELLHERAGDLRPPSPGRRPVGIASVYRALETLAELRLVKRIEAGDGIARFEPARRRRHHHHLVCRDCGKVEAFSDARLERAIDKVAGGLGYSVEEHEVVLTGACADCA